MTEIRETNLPGVGTMYDFTTSSGQRLGVIFHRSGRRELMVCEGGDADTCRDMVRLDDEDARVLREILGASRVTRDTQHHRLAQQGLTIDWIDVTEDARCAHCTLHEVEHRDAHAASIVAVVRDEQTIAAPSSDFSLHPHDVAVVIGTPEGIDSVTSMLQAPAGG